MERAPETVAGGPVSPGEAAATLRADGRRVERNGATGLDLVVAT